MNATKFGLLTYATENIGDEIQSIAARRFLPSIDYYFDRDNIDGTKIRSGNKVKLIMNGWYTHKPENWPPKNHQLEPLLISMHVEQDALNGAPAMAFINKYSQKFLSKFGPVGCRNIPTLKLLEKAHIPSYFSGCLTLTLNPDPKIPKKDFVLAVDVSDKVYKKIKCLTKREVIRLDTYRTRTLEIEYKMALAEYWLYLYQSAHLAITERLHCMLPCLALGTPVIAISGRDKNRYEGLIDLTNHMTEIEFLKNDSIDIEHPAKNPIKFKELRRALEKRCRDFTGYDSKLSFLNGKDARHLFDNSDLVKSIGILARASYDCDVAKEQIDFYKNEHEKLSARISELENPGVKKSVKFLAKSIVRKIPRR